MYLVLPPVWKEWCLQSIVTKLFKYVCNLLAKTGPKRQRGRPRKRTTSLVGEHGSVVSAVNISLGEMEAVSNKEGDKSIIQSKVEP